MPATPTEAEELAALYDSRYATGYMAEDRFGAWSRAGVERRRVLETLAEVPAGGVRALLDYGCGSGEWADTLRSRFGDARLCGVEISGTAVRLAAARHPGMEVRRFDGGRTPYPDGTFDLVFSYHVLEHVLDPAAVAAEMVRVTRPGGHLVVICPCGNRGSLEQRLAASVAGGFEPGRGGGPRFYFEDPAHLRRLTTDEATALFAAGGARRLAALYAHQRFGALEWIARSGRGFVATLFAGRRPIRPAAALRLGLLKTILSPLALLCDLGAAEPARASGRRRLLLQALWPARVAGRATALLLDGLARAEWRLARRRPGGSAQFLVFRKESGL